jgi:hypothetical protein
MRVDSKMLAWQAAENGGGIKSKHRFRREKPPLPLAGEGRGEGSGK